MSAPRDISDLKARLRRQPAATPVPPPAPVPAPSGVVEDPAQVSTDGGKTWAEAPAPPTLGTNGPHVAEALRRSLAPTRGAALLEAAAALARLGAAQVQNQDELDLDQAAAVAAACARALELLRPPQGELTLRLDPRSPAVALALRGADVNPQCATKRGGFHTVSVYPPDANEAQWYALESGYLKLGELQVELRLPARPATHEEIEQYKSRLDESGEGR